MFGNCAIGKLSMVSEPTSTKTIEITIATIGRLMKNFDMTSPAHRFGSERFRINPNAGAHLLNTFGNHAITWIETTCDHPTSIDLRPHCYRPDGYPVIGVKDGHLITTLEFRNGALRNEQSSLLCLDYCANFGVTAGFEDIV